MSHSICCAVRASVFLKIKTLKSYFYYCLLSYLWMKQSAEILVALSFFVLLDKMSNNSNGSVHQNICVPGEWLWKTVTLCFKFIWKSTFVQSVRKFAHSTRLWHQWNWHIHALVAKTTKQMSLYVSMLDFNFFAIFELKLTCKCSYTEIKLKFCRLTLNTLRLLKMNREWSRLVSVIMRTELSPHTEQ